MAKKKSAGAKYFGKPLSDDPDDAPELLNDFFRHGELRQGGRLIRRGRPPLSGKPKTAITLRFDEDVVSAYRKTGEGWQTRTRAVAFECRPSPASFLFEVLAIHVLLQKR